MTGNGEFTGLDAYVGLITGPSQTSKAYISSLQSRIQLLEGLLKEANNTPPPPLELDSEVSQMKSRSRSGKESSTKEKSKSRPKVVLSEEISESSSDDSGMKTKRKTTAPKGTGSTPRNESKTSPSIHSNNYEAPRVPLRKATSNEDRGYLRDFAFQYQKCRHELTSIMANILKFGNEQPFPINLSTFLYMSTFDLALERWYGYLPLVLRWSSEYIGSPVELFSLQ
jgi:hypothetical protein